MLHTLKNSNCTLLLYTIGVSNTITHIIIHTFFVVAIHRLLDAIESRASENTKTRLVTHKTHSISVVCLRLFV